ncbi:MULTISPECIES: sulfotransferase family protein [Aerosakkonema]|uniref:sulfotransferase family protein n=1 Tax=Aerosakkonema TaxID=1246629 RepID=UPI0035B7E90E
MKVCFITGVGHSGTTLLGLILGSHSDGFFCGETENTRILQEANKPYGKGVCKICGPECAIWGNIEYSPKLYEEISDKTKQPFIIDSTKNGPWIEQQMATVRNSSVETFLILMQRDGRASINSYIKRYPERDIKELIEKWVAKIRRSNALFDRFENKKMKVRYEELATNPDLVVGNICKFLEIDYQPDMLNFYQHEHHPLGGNDGTLLLVAKGQAEKGKEAFVNSSNWKIDYYRNHNLGIKLDDRWKQELDPAIQSLFQEIAGQENEELQWN